MALNPDCLAILAEMANRRHYPDTDGNLATAKWVAESCGHFYDTPWCSKRLPGLIKRGYVERTGLRGYYRITELGRSALAQSKGGENDR